MQNFSYLRKRLLLVSMAILLAACSHVHPTYVPDGRRGFVITCGGTLDDSTSCLIKAGRACGNSGYDTIRGSEDERAMLIACKLPK